MSYASAYNMARARKLDGMVDDWMRHARKVEAESARKDGVIEAWNMHYLALEAERDYLLELLDQKCGGKNGNPAREKITNQNLRIPNGPRKGQELQKRDVIYLKKMKDLAETRFKRWADWWGLVRDSRIFD